MASIINEYIEKRMSVLDLKKELSRLRSEYNKLTGRNLFIYAADFNKVRQGIDVSLMQDDFYMIQDILRESDKMQIDIYLETPNSRRKRRSSHTSRRASTSLVSTCASIAENC